jgi:hypothetical protein
MLLLVAVAVAVAGVLLSPLAAPAPPSLALPQALVQMRGVAAHADGAAAGGAGQRVARLLGGHAAVDVHAVVVLLLLLLLLLLVFAAGVAVGVACGEWVYGLVETAECIY